MGLHVHSLGELPAKAMEDTITADPSVAPVIPAPAASANYAGRARDAVNVAVSGPSIYFHYAGPEAIYLLTAYAKSAKKDLSPDDKKAWSKLFVAIKKEEREK